MEFIDLDYYKTNKEVMLVHKTYSNYIDYFPVQSLQNMVTKKYFTGYMVSKYFRKELKRIGDNYGNL